MPAQREKMTAQEAQSFGRFSITNATILAQAAVDRGCTCQPYRDWFTYERWQALGFQVQKGEHGTSLGVIIHCEKREIDETGSERVTTITRPWSSHVFCRCQVKAKDSEP